MINRVTYLFCDSPGCAAGFSSEGLPASTESYVIDAAVRRGWTVEDGDKGHRFICPAHSTKIKEAQFAPAEKAVRLLINNPAALRSAPPFLVGKLKLLLTDLNARTFTWKKS